MPDSTTTSNENICKWVVHNPATNQNVWCGRETEIVIKSIPKPHGEYCLHHAFIIISNMLRQNFSDPTLPEGDPDAP